MKGRAVEHMVYDYMFPKPKPSDPQSFHALLQRSLIPEVRQETHAFYGHLDTQEAKYPGLDYNHRTHRIRLSRFPWHRRLFRAFDGLHLTACEISGLTKWEGTKWAKEKYEKEQGVAIRDTTADGFPDWDQVRDVTRPRETASNAAERRDDDDIMEDEDSEDELQSVGVELNERLRAQAARRDAGDDSVVLDEEWEQWLKNAIERGELSATSFPESDVVYRAGGEGFRVAFPTMNAPPQEFLTAGRAGAWHIIPESIRPMVSRILDAENASREESSSPASGAGADDATPTSAVPRLADLMARDIPRLPASSSPWPASRRTYSDLRLPVGTSATTQRTA